MRKQQKKNNIIIEVNGKENKRKKENFNYKKHFKTIHLDVKVETKQKLTVHGNTHTKSEAHRKWLKKKFSISWREITLITFFFIFTTHTNANTHTHTHVKTHLHEK